MDNQFELLHGDCLDLMRNVESASVDLILCDLPYGTTACKWDAVIPFLPLWEHYKRIIKTNGAIILTASQPFTSALIMSNPMMFKYELIWDKKNGKAPGVAKFRPMPSHESILVFGTGRTTYNPQWGIGERYVNKRTNDKKRNQIDGHKLGYSGAFEINNDGRRYPLSVIEVKTAPIRGQHPTQKPVALMEYLIRTYSNEGDTVLDNCMGSGTTGVACKNTGRRFIGIEKDAGYFAIAERRIFGADQGPAKPVQEDLFAA